MSLFSDSSKNETLFNDKKSIEEEMSQLKELHKSNEKDGKELKQMINDLHKRLKTLDHKTPAKKRDNQVSYSISDMQSLEDKLILHKKITIKKRRRSKSFMKWLFNNLDL